MKKLTEDNLNGAIKSQWEFKPLDPYDMWIDPRQGKEVEEQIKRFEKMYQAQPPVNTPDAYMIPNQKILDQYKDILGRIPTQDAYYKWHDGSAETFERNQFGVRMYDLNCQLCREHVEDWYTCEVCNQRAMVSLMHVEDSLEPVPMRLLSAEGPPDYHDVIKGKTKERVEETGHACPFTNALLKNFLC